MNSRNMLAAANAWGAANMEKLKKKVEDQANIIESVEKLNLNLRKQNMLMIKMLDGETKAALEEQEKEITRLTNEKTALAREIEKEKKFMAGWFDLYSYHMDQFMMDFEEIKEYINTERKENNGRDGDGDGGTDGEGRSGEQRAAEDHQGEGCDEQQSAGDDRGA